MATAKQVGPDPTHETQSPVKDASKTGMTEDIDREPDGVPHSVVGFTALFSVMLAMLVAGMFIAGGTFVRILAVLLAAVAVPLLVGQLRTKAARDRDHVHPSR